jgi:molybdopterin-guanine dinucleotide biosynthesis protein B
MLLTKFIGITGKKKTGKTTTIEQVVPQLRKKGLKVGTVKIAFKAVSVDVNQEQYDVIRHRKAEPEKTMFKSSVETTIFYNQHTSLKNALREFGKGLDIVLLEGFKEDLQGFPQVVLLKEEDEVIENTDDYTVIISSIPEFSVTSNDSRYVVFEALPDEILKHALPIFPGLDCAHCGYQTCQQMVKEIIKGNNTAADCYILATQTDDVVLTVNDKLIPCNPFVRTIIKNNILGIVNALKLEEEEIKEITITVNP